MASYLVIKLPNVVDASNPIPTAFIAQDREDSAIALFEPGRDFIRVGDGGSPEAAEEQAKAYWDGTHQSPEQIDAWVEQAKGRKQELPPSSMT